MVGEVNVCTECVRGNLDDIKYNESHDGRKWPNENQMYEKYNGCSSCGGYGYTEARKDCPRCGKELWHRPGCYTIYVGKVKRISRGESIKHLGSVGELRWVCLPCAEKIDEIKKDLYEEFQGTKHDMAASKDNLNVT